MERFVNIKPIENDSLLDVKPSASSLSSVQRRSVIRQDDSCQRLISAFAYSAYQTASRDNDELHEMHTWLPNRSRLLPPISQPVDLNVFTGLRFAWLDRFINETPDIYDEISGTFQWDYYQSEEDQCIQTIRNQCITKRVFLITNGYLGQRVVPQIHVLPQLYCVYIYCQDVEYHFSWAWKYSKVRVVCNNDDLWLLPQFALDVAQANIDWGDALLRADRRSQAKTKFKKALDNLLKHVNPREFTLIKEVEQKLKECE